MSKNTIIILLFMLGSLFYPEDGGRMFLRNIGKLLPDYTASHPFVYSWSQ
jgi:hypothetical protein